MIFCVENNAAVFFFLFFLQTINSRLSGSGGEHQTWTTLCIVNYLTMRMSVTVHALASKTFWPTRLHEHDEEKSPETVSLTTNSQTSLGKMCFFLIPSEEKRLVCERLALCLHHKKPRDGT